ncbi:MAG: hypothetical protein OES57_03785 [Acidimicrobiia bacterium]|nr:hypothetical protein [Acidimicrobiia bacterium]
MACRVMIPVVIAVAGLVFSLVSCGDDDDGMVTVSVAVSDLETASGTELAGVLLSDTSAGGTAVAAFAVVVDADPFSHVEPLGNVSEEVDDETADSGLWPWPTGVASVPAGTYTLRVALGTDYCCYSRWVPADTPDLRLCDVEVTITGKDQTIEITDIPMVADDGVGVCGVG